jgi:hypothetical protein
MSIPRRETVNADPRLALLRAWLSIGVVLLILLPPTQWHNAAVGWLPYWLLVAPSISLALLRRRRLLAALGAILRRGPRRRNARAATRRAVRRRHRAPGAGIALIPR